MTVTLPNVFGTKPSGNVAASQLDTNFADLAQQAILQTTVGGTANAITLTLANITVTAFTDIEATHLGFVATANSTASVTINAAALGTKNLYRQDGTTQAASGTLVSGQYYEIVYRAALNSSAGGFQIVNQTTTSLGTEPTITVETSGSGTYTTPNGATRLYVRMVGGGGGGGGGGSGAGGGGNGGNTTFGASLTAGGGTGGQASGGGTCAGGTATGGDVNIVGGDGISGVNFSGTGTSQGVGGPGRDSFFGGGGKNGDLTTASTAGKANSGGGGGGGAGALGGSAGMGGAAGGYIEKNIVSPAATYAFAVGGGGTAGASGTGGSSGAAGGSGIIIVQEYYD